MKAGRELGSERRFTALACSNVSLALAYIGEAFFSNRTGKW